MPGDDPRSDEELIAAINAGDANAFEALYRRHRDYVVRIAHRYTGDADLALDVMQETFLYLLRKFPGFRFRGRLTTYLYPITRHNAQQARRKAVRLKLADDLSATPAPAPSATTDDVAALLTQLSEQHREVLLMRFVDGMSLQEIATTLRLRVGTVKSRLHHALRKLRDDPRTKFFFEP